MDNKKTNTVSFEIDLESSRVIGASDGASSMEQDIGRRVFETISNTLRGMSDDWLSVFDKEIALGDHVSAFGVFNENKGLLQFSKNRNALEKLKALDVSKLDREGRKEYLIFLVAYSDYVGDVLNSQVYIESLLKEYEGELESLLVQNFILQQANIAAISGMRNKASILYKKVIDFPDPDSATIAWAYQGMSKIADNDADIISFAQKAADKHLECGARDGAIRNFLTISSLKSNDSPRESIELIDRCIDLYGSERLMDRELLASLYFNKAQYLYRINQAEDAFPFAEQACDLRRGLLGNEIEFFASLSLAAILATFNGESDKADAYKKEGESVAALIDDPEFVLRLRLGDKILQRDFLDEDFLSEIIAFGDAGVLSAALLYQSSDDNMSIEGALENLDKARILIEKQHDKRLLDSVYFAIAEKYRCEGMISEAFANYKKSLSCNQHLNASVQNCVVMLFESERWLDAEEFIKARISLVGELPNICAAYGRALYENKKYDLAYKYFLKSSSDVLDRDFYISECLKHISDQELCAIGKREVVAPLSISAEDFYSALKEFAFSVSSDSRMHFWYFDKAVGKYKWTKNPEELSKQMLITFLNGKFGKGMVEIVQEPRAGAGFIDIYVLLSGGLKVVIELKMCGNGYSSTYVLSGESQIIHYQINKGTKLGYLVVLDSRSRDYGKHFKKLQTVDGHTIYTVAADMRPLVDKG